MARPKPNPDVIIIGAGLAGLFAALTLEAGGASVLVLESQTGPAVGCDTKPAAAFRWTSGPFKLVVSLTASAP